VSAKGGEEIESRTGSRSGRIRAEAAIMILGSIGDLTGFSVIMQSVQGYRGVDAISGQALARLMAVGRDALPLEYGEARMCLAQ
jgi:hypothetical protein